MLTAQSSQNLNISLKDDKVYSTINLIFGRATPFEITYTLALLRTTKILPQGVKCKFQFINFDLLLNSLLF